MPQKTNTKEFIEIVTKTNQSISPYEKPELNFSSDGENISLLATLYQSPLPT